MPREKRIEEDVVLGVFELAGVELSADEFSRNFNVDKQRIETVLERLSNRGYLQYDGDGYYTVSEEGSEHLDLVMRSSSLS